MTMDRLMKLIVLFATAALTAGQVNQANPSPTDVQPTQALTATAGNNPITRPLMAAAALDNPRMMLLPYMSSFGALPSWYYALGGADKFMSALTSEFVNGMISRSTGLNPLMSTLLTKSIVDTPDRYLMTNLLMNGQSGQNGPSGQAATSGSGFSSLAGGPSANNLGGSGSTGTGKDGTNNMLNPLSLILLGGLW